jgi:hypothetical protein
MSDHPDNWAEETYSLRKVAKMFRTSPERIKQRALAGEFPYQVDSRGQFVFTKESLLAHLDELIKRNNRIG